MFLFELVMSARFWIPMLKFCVFLMFLLGDRSASKGEGKVISSPMDVDFVTCGGVHACGSNPMIPPSLTQAVLKEHYTSTSSQANSMKGPKEQAPKPSSKRLRWDSVKSPSGGVVDPTYQEKVGGGSMVMKDSYVLPPRRFCLIRREHLNFQEYQNILHGGFG